MKYRVHNCMSGNVQFVAEIDYDDAAFNSTKMGLAVHWALKNGVGLRGADLGGACLRGADLGDADFGDADLGGADLGGANLGGAYFRYTRLCDADFSGADLRGADFSGADLRGADFGEQWIVQGPIRSDGYFFFLTNFMGEGVRVKAGCRNFTLAQARGHWRATRAGTPLGEETFIILDYLEAIARARGLK